MKQLRNSKAQSFALFTLVSGIVIAIAVICFLAKLAGSGSYADVARSSEIATRTHIQPVGQLTLGDGTPVDEHKGDQIFNKICTQCRDADKSTPNAPEIGNNGEWAPRIAQGFDTFFQHVLNGFNAIPAKGDTANLTDQEPKRIITYMADKNGGIFPDPDTAAPTDTAASGEAASVPAVKGVAPAEAPKADTAEIDDKGTAAPVTGGVDGKKVYEVNCQACHGGAVPSAPHISKRESWALRIKQGKDALHKHALEGFNAMPAKGGNGNLSDNEMKAAVGYMANQSSAKL